MINIWVAIRADLLEDDRRIGRILSHPDLAHVDRMMKRKTLGGNEWRLYSVYIEPTTASKNKLLNWVSNHSNKVIIAGAWHFYSGLQVGTRLNDDDEIVGTPRFPVDSRLIQFMPDDVVYDSNGDEISRVNATTLKQVNKVHGQADRVF